MVQQVGDFRTPDFVLARQAGDVRAGPTDPAALDDHAAALGARHVPGQQLAARAAAKHEVLVRFRLSHTPLLPQAVRWHHQRAERWMHMSWCPEKPMHDLGHCHAQITLASSGWVHICDGACIAAFDSSLMLCDPLMMPKELPLPRSSQPEM